MTETQTALPRHAEVVIIGGGVIGMSAALLLTKRGNRVVLCEKDRVAGEQSSRNWGWIRKQGRDLRELPLMIESAALWGRFAREVDEPFGYGVRGVTYLTSTEAELARHAAWLDSVSTFQFDSRMLSAAETAALFGRNETTYLGALHTSSDATAEPRLAVPAIARRARALGATILESVAVRTIERAGGARCAA